MLRWPVARLIVLQVRSTYFAEPFVRLSGVAKHLGLSLMPHMRRRRILVRYDRIAQVCRGERILRFRCLLNAARAASDV
jgi:hypothetical protein